MKSILLATQPRHVLAKIEGRKTIEVRKSAPKPPFKVYEYCTVSGNDKLKNQLVRMEDTGEWKLCSATDLSKYRVNGKVVLEYAVDSVSKFDIAGLEFYMMKDHLLNLSALTETELRNYIGNGIGYAWRISDLKLYDEPLELKEFERECKYYGKNCVTDDGEDACIHYDHSVFGCRESGLLPIIRPPQSWMYVRRRDVGA